MLVPSVRQLSMLHPAKPVGLIWKLFGIVRKQSLPFRVCFGSPRAHSFLKALVNSIGHKKLRVFRPAIKLLYQLDFRFAERLAVRFVGILLVRGSIANVAVHHNQRWLSVLL